jgi:hypothetical protein
MADLPARMKWMDSRGVGMHLLTLSGGMPWQWAPQDAANKLARIVNDAAIEAHKAYPDRFVAGAALPIRDPAAAMKELDRVAGAPGMRAVHLPNSIEGRDYIFEPQYLPLLAHCEELGYPLVFHPLDGVEPLRRARRLGGPSFIYNALGFPFETATTATKFILNGLLDRFPSSISCCRIPAATSPVAGRISTAATGARKPTSSSVPRVHPALSLRLARLPETLRFMVDLIRIGPHRDRHGQLRADGRRSTQRAGGIAEAAGGRLRAHAAAAREEKL